MLVILGSESPSRLKLLNRIKIVPDKIIPANIDETPLKKEKAHLLSKRLAIKKAQHITTQINYNAIIIAADTVVENRQQILAKAESDDLVECCLRSLSGRRSRLYTSVCMIKKDENSITTRIKTVKTTIKFKRLTENEISYYIKSQEGLNKAGGFAIEGIAGSFIEFISGSYSNIVGLPLFETRNMLISLGFKF